MRLLAASRKHRCVLALFLVLFAASCIAPPYPRYVVMQHLPTVAGVAALAIAERRARISFFSYSLLVLFLSLHVLGARYIYSYVPYDAWTEAWFGCSITSQFGFARNHYDRFVHLCFGLLASPPAYRFHRRFLKLSPKWSFLAAVQFIMAASALYELAEWLVGLTFAPDWAEQYNGQQGDLWDPHKDMALAAIGAVFSASLLAIWGGANETASSS